MRKSRVSRTIETLKRRVLHVVPAVGWDAVCIYPGRATKRWPIVKWALVEEVEVGFREVIGVRADGRFGMKILNF